MLYMIQFRTDDENGHGGLNSSVCIFENVKKRISMIFIQGGGRGGKE